MPRPHRVEVPGVPLHVIQRGNNRAACFFGDVDRRLYLKCLAECASARGCAIHAYVLMPNHVHLLLTPGEKGATSAMLQDLGRRYVRTINDAHERTGTLWEGRFKSHLVDSDRYLFVCHRYIELNPVRAGIVAGPADFPWSSHQHYRGERADPLIQEHAAYLSLGSSANERRHAFLSSFGEEIDLERIRTAVNKGWALGTESFVGRMESITGRILRPAHRGRPAKVEQPEAESLHQPELQL